MSDALSAIEKIPEYKMNILNRAIESDRLSKLLYYDSPDALFLDSLDDSTKQSLIYSRVFPFRFVPDPINNQGTFLTISISGFTAPKISAKEMPSYLNGSIYFYMFTHTDLMRTHSGVRQDLVLSEITRIFDGARGLGIGKISLRYVDELWIHNNKFGGYTASFTITDFS